MEIGYLSTPAVSGKATQQPREPRTSAEGSTIVQQPAQGRSVRSACDIPGCTTVTKGLSWLLTRTGCRADTDALPRSANHRGGGQGRVEPSTFRFSGAICRSRNVANCRLICHLTATIVARGRLTSLKVYARRLPGYTLMILRKSPPGARMPVPVASPGMRGRPPAPGVCVYAWRPLRLA